METSFDEATTVTSVIPGRYKAQVLPEWFGGAGPSGGYLAAILLRALVDTVAEPERRPRTLSCRFLSSSANGDADICVTTRKSGRRVSYLEASLEQDGKPCVLASATFAVAADSGMDYCDAVMPDVSAPEDLPLRPCVPPDPPLFSRLHMRDAFSSTGSCGQASKSVRCLLDASACAGGWIRLKQPRVTDVFALCLYADAWLPSPTHRLGKMPLAPTLDFTVYFREPVTDDSGADDFSLVVATSLCAHEGYFEEDAVVWSRRGRLLAQSRQFAILH